MLNGQIVEVSIDMPYWIKTDIDIIQSWLDCGAIFESSDGYYGIKAGEMLIYVGDNHIGVEIDKYIDFKFVPVRDTTATPIRIPLPDLFSSFYLVK